MSDDELWLYCLNTVNYEKHYQLFILLIKEDVYAKKHGHAIFMHKKIKK